MRKQKSSCRLARLHVLANRLCSCRWHRDRQAICPSRLISRNRHGLRALVSGSDYSRGLYIPITTKLAAFFRFVFLYSAITSTRWTLGAAGVDIDKEATPFWTSEELGVLFEATAEDAPLALVMLRLAYLKATPSNLWGSELS